MPPSQPSETTINSAMHRITRVLVGYAPSVLQFAPPDANCAHAIMQGHTRDDLFVAVYENLQIKAVQKVWCFTGD